MGFWTVREILKCNIHLIIVGVVAKQIFDRAQLPNDVLIRIWNLADSEQRGRLSVIEFIIAMHLLASFRSGAMRALPNNLPAGLYEAAARRGVPARSPPVSAIPRSFTGQSATARTSSPLGGQQYSSSPSLIQGQTAGLGNDWAVPSNEKAIYDQQFARLDINKSGLIGGEQAVGFFSNSKLSENDLAQIWDLADITQNGQLSQDEFAVAMHLIRQMLNGKSPLPTTLPTNLIPPSLRRSIPTTQATIPAPAPNHSYSSPPRAASALDDLFGLDAAPINASKQIPQSTGGSAAASSSSILKNMSPTPPTSHFKQFVPSSSFGQSIITPQFTGQPVSSGVIRQQTSVDEDLLGDADPEESKRFTQETTDVANLNNQINSLDTQTRDVQTIKASTEQEFLQSSTQKREIETRLAHLRTTYEHEARDFKSLQDRFNISKAETTQLQQDLVMIQHSFQVLLEQKQEVSTGLEADQKENADLKEQIAQIQRETAQVQPEIERLKTDARQQKGLVAIHKKQLITAQSEREKIKSELENATSQHTQANKDLEETQRALESSKLTESSRVIPTPTLDTPAATTVTSAVESPDITTSSMNPFFRRAQSSSSQGGIVPPPSAAALPNHSAFDSFFDNPFAPAGTDDQSNTREIVPSASETTIPTKRDTIMSQNDAQPTLTDLPPASHQPPPPPRSRQMTPSVLPLRSALPRTTSTDSSLGVVAPASQFDDVSERSTPTKERVLALTESHPEVSSAQLKSSMANTSNDSESIPTPEIPSPEIPSPESKSAFNSVPGAFPLESPADTSEFSPMSMDSAKDIPASQQVPNGTATNRFAFDTLFGNFGAITTEGKGKAPVSDSAFGSSGRQQTEEFPPIRELGHDDEDSSDDDSDLSLGPDNVTSQKFTNSNALPSTLNGGGVSRPNLDRAPSTDLPTPNAQQPPPTYSEMTSPQSSEHRDANKFAAEYTGLLPSREDPTTLSQPYSASNGKREEPTLPITNSTVVQSLPFISQFLPANAKAIAQPKPEIVHDDFDDAFGDLSEARPAEVDAADDLMTSNREGFDDFNPTFDSPAPSKAPTLDSNVFHDFESNFPASSQSINAPSAARTTSKSGPSKDEWDAMFAGFGNESATSQTNASTAQSVNQGKPDDFLDAFDIPPTTAQDLPPTQRPDPTRAPTDHEHDDPIVKHLTAMGYSRTQSVEALEKFDYNLDKVCVLDSN